MQRLILIFLFGVACIGHGCSRTGNVASAANAATGNAAQVEPACSGVSLHRLTDEPPPAPADQVSLTLNRVTHSELLAVVDERPDLQVLHLVDGSFGGGSNLLEDESLLALSTMPALIELVIHGAHRITDSGVMHLQSLQALEKLQISNCGRITGESMHLAEKLPKLRDFALRWRWSATDANLACLSRPRLERLVLRGTVATEHGLCEMIRGLTVIRTLDLSGIPQCSDAAALAIAESAFELEHLSLAGTRITDAALTDLARLPNLRFLDVGSCSQLTRAAIRDLQDTRTNLEVLSDH